MIWLAGIGSAAWNMKDISEKTGLAVWRLPLQKYSSRKGDSKSHVTCSKF